MLGFKAPAHFIIMVTAGAALDIECRPESGCHGDDSITSFLHMVEGKKKRPLNDAPPYVHFPRGGNRISEGRLWQEEGVGVFILVVARQVTRPPLSQRTHPSMMAPDMIFSLSLWVVL